MPDLIPRQVHDLGPVAQALIYYAPGPGNITAVNLAYKLLNDIKDNITTYNGAPIIDIMRKATFNKTLEMPEALNVLDAMTRMPMDYQHGLALIWGAMIVVASPMLFLRLYSRIRYSGGLKRDDYFLIVAWVVATANNIQDMHLAVVDDFGAHGWNVTRKQMLAHVHIGAVDGYLFAISSWFFKISLVIFFHDLYTAKGFRIMVYCLGAFLTLFSAGLIVYLNKRCSPFDRWNHLFDAVCIPQALDIAKALTIINILIDFLILCLPIYIVFHMNLRMRERVQVILLMGLGTMVCIASIMRYNTLQYWIESSDSTWRSIPITHWTLLETQLGIFCASVPAVRKLLVQLIPRLKQWLSPLTPKPSPFTSNATANSALSSGKHSDHKRRVSEEQQPRFGNVLRSFGSGRGGKRAKKQPPVGDITAIMNMKTDLESGMGTMSQADRSNIGGSRIMPEGDIQQITRNDSQEVVAKEGKKEGEAIRVIERSSSGDVSISFGNKTNDPS